MSVEENLRLMKTLDDAWNAGPGSPEWETFRKRHVYNVAVYWPGQPDPTRGIHNHESFEKLIKRRRRTPQQSWRGMRGAAA